MLLGGVIFGIIAGIAIGVQLNRWLLGWIQGFLFFLLFMLVIGVPSGMVLSGVGGAPEQIALAMAGGATAAAFLTALIVPAYLLAERLAGPSAGAIASALASGLGMVIFLWNAYSSIAPIAPSFWQMLGPCLVGLPLGLTLSWWMPVVLYPFLAAWNLVLLRADARPTPAGHALLRYHSAFWDEHQRLPLVGLDDHVILIAERSPAEGRAALAYLSTSRQRWAAQAAQIELDARQLERCPDVQAISAVYQSMAAGDLEGPASALLRSFSRNSQDVDAALRQASAYNQRLALSAAEDRLDGLLRELTRSSERYAARFRPVATRWRQIIANHLHTLAVEVEQRQEIDSPYIIGVPLTEQQEVFVGRADISTRIEQLLLDRRRPPLLLYGQRRMGKTSLLNNLGRLLPSTVIPLFVDLQGPASQSSDHVGLLYNLARGMTESARRHRSLALPPLSRDSLMADPFTRFDEWLDEVEATLGQSAALLTLDEFESLDSAITKGRFDEEQVLGMLRNLIQHRPRFKVLLAGSHTLEELERWASYLINAQIVRIDYLKEAEARQLVERPVEDFALRYEPDASQRVLVLTRGHPFLVQLLCAEIVALKNEQEPSLRRLTSLADVEAAVPEALSSGSLFFADIQHNQVDAAGLALLRSLAAYGEGVTIARETLVLQFVGDLSTTLDLLARRELIEAVNGGYRFQVELIRRWFAQGV
ncbi:MAG: ATP-binding protein [Chloroflexota bacterium]|nr:ATP-binding protein [Chloroflexota bacterium]